MKRAIVTATLVAVGLPGATALAQVGLPPSEVRDASAAMEGLAGTFVLLHEGRRLEHAPERAGTRFVPASTFKIANTLIALETGVATGPDFVLEWDGIVPEDRFWPESWSRDHSLHSAFRNGVLWYEWFTPEKMTCTERADAPASRDAARRNGSAIPHESATKRGGMQPPANTSSPLG